MTARKYIEITAEGDYKFMRGLLDGFILGSNLDADYYFSKDAGIESESLGELLKEIVTLRLHIHHLVMNADLYDQFTKAIGGGKASSAVSRDHIKSERPVKDASFTFTARTFGRKYANEIKELLKGLPGDVRLEGFEEKEDVEVPPHAGVELYTPDHDYAYEAKGKLFCRDLKTLIEIRDKMDYHPLIEVEKIRLLLD